jgi:hypothetical protein
VEEMTSGSKAMVTAEEKSSLVLQRVVHETGSSWPMLNHTNYADWALLMQVMLEAWKLWVAVTDGMPEREMDHTAMECLYYLSRQRCSPTLMSR